MAPRSQRRPAGFGRRPAPPRPVGSGSYLVWDIANVGGDPITVTKLVTYSRTGPDIVPLGMAHELKRHENLTFGMVILGLGFFMLMWVIATG
jgi:hypothetical protein